MSSIKIEEINLQMLDEISITELEELRSKLNDTIKLRYEQKERSIVKFNKQAKITFNKMMNKYNKTEKAQKSKPL